MLSFVVPAYNEELELPATIAAIGEAAQDRSARGRIRRGQQYEIVVVDASTDATAEIARSAGAEVVLINRCDFRDPWGNRIQVVDFHDESLIWLLPYREVQKAGVNFSGNKDSHQEHKGQQRGN
jgi:glycosyltransferase involved in cell wall biosynthesis